MDHSGSKITHKTDHTKAEAKAEILFLEEKYEKVKQKLYHKKLLGQLNNQDIDEIGNLMNIIAMKYSQEGYHKAAEQWLRRVLKHIQHSSRMAIITYNNLACVYRQSNNLPMALLYIKKAQKQADLTCLDNEDDSTLKVVTDCSLNLCAILSSMGEHYKALKAAKKALYLISNTPNVPKSYFNTLYPVIKFNEAVEYQRLKMFPEARQSYIEAIGSPGITQQLAARINQAIESLKGMKNEYHAKSARISVQKTIMSSRQNSQACCSLPNTGRKSLHRKHKFSQKLVKISTARDSSKNSLVERIKSIKREKGGNVLGEIYNI